MNNSPPFKRHSVGRTYPWQVAPQQSLLPFRFNNTKFKSVNYIYNLSKFPATFTVPIINLTSMGNPGSKNLLSKAFRALEDHGDFVDVTVRELDVDRYLSIGQWLSTASALNDKADFRILRIFFAQNNPVIVFADATKSARERLYEVYNSLWSFARPRLAFIEHDAVVDIFDLAEGAARDNSDLRPLRARISQEVELVNLIKGLTRENITHSEVFGENRFRSINKRADQALISDLKTVRRSLFENGLNGRKLKYAHALIGRCIFVRYLEDRGVLDKEYFLSLARRNKKWLKIINTPLDLDFYQSEMSERIFPRVLQDKELTYAFFSRLSRDFNGDTFFTDDKEQRVVSKTHLLLLRDFLTGRGASPQQSFFLWAYRFDVIPVDLISSIYEEFYHASNVLDEKARDDNGTHYTPASLVDYTLSRVLTASALSKNPRILDPACGSGIFLVETFRRIVRYRLHNHRKRNLRASELLTILRTQIAGIEINPEAVKIAAFSLYLSFLNYLKPPSILRYIKSGGRLPNLIFSGGNSNANFKNLVAANAFSAEVIDKIFSPGSFDIVVGNPPWGTPPTTDQEARNELRVIESWCLENNRILPDKEPSHAFIWRSLSFLKENGTCALLVSSGVLYKFSKISNQFKRNLFSTYKVTEIVSFANVRDVFFSKAISPFLLIKIENKCPGRDHTIKYTALKNSLLVSKNRIVIADGTDVKYVPNDQASIGNVWKIYHWGNEYDYKLISAIKRFEKLAFYADMKVTAQGFQVANESKDADWLGEYMYVPVTYFDNKYQSLNLKSSEDRMKLQRVPNRVKVRGNRDIFQGPRILIRRGILQRGEPKGQIIVRVERDKFAFNHSLICIKLKEEYLNDTELFAALLWSSLFRYYMFMTASTWGTWHQEIHLNEVLEFPIAMPDEELRSRILRKASELVELNKSKGLLSYTLDQAAIRRAEKELDQLIFELYRLTNFEQQLVRERCAMDIDMYYNGLNSLATKPVESISDFEAYANHFIRKWERYLEANEVFKAALFHFDDWVAMTFFLDSEKGERDLELKELDIKDASISRRLEGLRSSAEIRYEPLIRSVSRDQIIIIKRNQKRLWSITNAQQDVDATLLMAMNKLVVA